MKLNSTSYETTILNAFVFIVAYLFFGIAVPSVLNTILWKPLGGSFSTWINIAALVISNVVFFIRVAKITDYKIAIFNNITIKGIVSAVVSSVLFFLLLDNFLDHIVDRMFPVSAVNYQETLIVLRQSPITTFIRVCIFAPITEELLMRGYVLTGLKNKYGILTALFISAILFGVFHFNFGQTLSAFICGMVIGLLYIKTDSLFCCMLAHSLYNSISYFTIITV